MVDINRFFPSKYLRPADIDGAPILTIRSISVVSLNGVSKLLCEFEELPKGLLLNVGNARTVAALAGSTNSDDWIGMRVALKVLPTSFQGTSVDGIRVVPAPARKGESHV